MPDVIPGSDGHARLWMRHFADVIGERPGDFHLSEMDAAEIREAVSNFIAAFDTAFNEGTRTPVNIRLKKEARKQAERICRKFASQIRKNPAVDNIQRMIAGLRPVEFRQTRLDLQRRGGFPRNRCLVSSDPASDEGSGA